MGPAVVSKPDFAWNESDPLARSEGETLNAWAALNDYCRMGAGRSLAGLLERYQSGTKPGPSNRLNTLKSWSGKYSWIDRAEAFDKIENSRQTDQYRARNDALQETLFKAAEIGAKRVLEGLENSSVGRHSFADFLKMLSEIRAIVSNLAGSEVSRLEVSTPEGRPLEYRDMDASRALDLFSQALEAGHFSGGLSDE